MLNLIESAFLGAFLRGKDDMAISILLYGKSKKILMGIPTRVLKIHQELILGKMEEFSELNVSIYRQLIQCNVLFKDEQTIPDTESERTQADMDSSGQNIILKSKSEQSSESKLTKAKSKTKADSKPGTAIVE